MSMLAWPSSPRRASSGDLHAPELAAVDVGDAVMPRQPLVDERVVGIQQIHDAAVFAHDAVEEQRRLFLHRLAKVVVEIGERFQIRSGALEIAQVQPLLGEVGDQRVGSRVRQHPLDLLLEHGRVFQFALRSQASAVDRPEYCSRGRTTAATPARGRPADRPCSGARFGGSRLEAEQELRAREDELKRGFDAAIEALPPVTPARPRR